MHSWCRLFRRRKSTGFLHPVKICPARFFRRSHQQIVESDGCREKATSVGTESLCWWSVAGLQEEVFHGCLFETFWIGLSLEWAKGQCSMFRCCIWSCGVSMFASNDLFKMSLLDPPYNPWGSTRVTVLEIMGGQRISIPHPLETQWKVFNPQSCCVFL